MLAFVLAFAVALGLWGSVGQAHAAGTAADGLPNVGDTVYFGRYPQELWDKDNPNEEPDTGVEGVDWVKQVVKIFPSPYTYGDPAEGTTGYYKVEPIAWRVLGKNDGKLFLLAEKVLDMRNYSALGMQSPTTWETGLIRSWLNNYGQYTAGSSWGNEYADSFIGTAFTADESASISPTVLINRCNPVTGIEGGQNTIDKVFLLSYQDVINTAYGFVGERASTDALRMAQATALVRAKTAYTMNYARFRGITWWFLRSPGSSSENVASVLHNGSVEDLSASSVMGVRPAINLDMASVDISSKGIGVWEAAETHSWSPWEVAVPPTEEAEGTETRTCSACGKFMSQSLAKLPPTEAPTDETPTDETPTDETPRGETPAGETPLSTTSQEARSPMVVDLPVSTQPIDTPAVAKIRTPLKTVYLTKGGSYRLRYVLDGPDGKPVSDPKLAIVWTQTKNAIKVQSIRKGSAGELRVKANRQGRATVTLMAQNGKTLKVKVVVQKKKIALKKFTAKLPKKLKKGKSYRISISGLTKKATDISAVTFKSSKKSIATVDAAGKVTALKKGKAKITVKVGKKTIVKKISVK
ncbi:MAG: Ig-like domain-containing protein [Clostridiales Family XIII bacterium]|nr:Ig-like domain-containing protein [Clostridiales Family XIII bacterium]